MEEEVKLPEGYEISEFFFGPSYDDGHEILFKNCRYCVKEPNCGITKALRSAMGENYPFWPDVFISIESNIVWPPYKQDETKTNFCTEYEDRQTRLSGIPSDYSDGVMMAVRLVDGKIKNII
jgi:hypothetical protein